MPQNDLKSNGVRGILFILAISGIFFTLLSGESFGVEITVINSQSYPTIGANWTISDTTPDLNFIVSWAANITYSWDSEGNISGCRNCTVFNTTYGENNGSDANLAALYHFNENYGGMAYDDSGNGNDGALGNATAETQPVWTSGKFGPALRFDGNNDFVNISDDGSIDFGAQQDFTLSAWIRSSGTGRQVIFNKYDGTDGEGYHLDICGGAAWCGGGNALEGMVHESLSTDSIVAYGTTDINDGKWHHVAMVANYTVGQLMLYVDGINEGNGSLSIINESLANSLPLYIGQYNEGGRFNGTIDEVAIYNRSLSGAEIQGLYSKSLANGFHCVTVYATNSTGSINSTERCFTMSVPTPGTVRVATNRQVILDEPNTVGIISPGYPNPSYDWASYAYWTGEATTIRAYALVMDDKGLAMSNADVIFTLLNPGGVVVDSSVVTTGTDGQASYYFDLNDQDYWGKWTITALVSGGSIVIYRSTEFVYNWWGCGNCHSGRRHNPTRYSVSPPNNPYLPGYDRVHTISMGMGGAHSNIMATNNCLRCHQSYGIGAAGSQYPVGFHNNKKTCQSCHGDGNDIRGTTYNGVPDMPSCYGAGCHSIKNTELTSVSTLDPFSTDARGNPRTKYSDNPPAASGNPLKNHTNSKVSCVLCHNQMHNITKPDPLPANSNGYTEDSQCKTCHSPRVEHNNQVKCTTCHSQDVHNISFFNATGNYIKNSASAGDCTTCHQQTTAWNTLLTQPKVGVYSGSGPPQVPVPLNHSDNVTGQRWGSYWTTGNDLSACNYCHGDTKHSAAALGRPANWNGVNTVNSSLNATNNWCAGCHYQGYSSGGKGYTDMVSEFTGVGLSVPPEITRNSAYAPAGTTGYFNHSLGNYSDKMCSYCHDGLAPSATNISSLLHNIGTGRQCENCHFSWSKMNDTFSKPLKYMNETRFTQSVHGISSVFPSVIFCTSCHTKISNGTDYHLTIDPGIFTPPQSGWKWCEDCHVVNQTTPVSNRHNLTDNPSTNMFNSTDSVIDVTDCTTCHNATLYNSAKATYNKTSGKNCRFCHAFPDLLPGGD